MELLNQMDGFDSLGKVKIIMATNRPDTVKLYFAKEKCLLFPLISLTLHCCDRVDLTGKLKFRCRMSKVAWRFFLIIFDEEQDTHDTNL
jgi:hypothetical protein